ncbi:MAG: group 1 glycosyl transferase [Rhodobacteraceae bacterium]|nr:MAG: group 1 glycosyl transferase [Paracoccaceae bacterium]
MKQNTPTRVVVINDTSTARGGATELALMSVRLLRARAVPVTYICGDSGLNDDLTTLGVTVIAANQKPLLERATLDAMKSGIHNPGTCALIARYVRDHDSPGTIYHVHGWSQILSPSIFAPLVPVAARTIIHAHDMFLACPNGAYMDYPRNRICAHKPLGLACLTTQCDKRSYAQKLWRVTRQLALHRSFDQKHPWAAIITLHPQMQPFLTRAGYAPARIHTLRNPASPFSATRIRAENAAGIAFVGRLERDKGVLNLAAAAARCAMPLTLIGDGPLRAQLSEQYPEATMAGWQDHDNIRHHLTNARALVMPTHHPEPFGLVTPEAVQSGLPVIVAETALIAQDVASNGFGRDVDVFDPTAMERALMWIRDMPDDAVKKISIHCHAAGQQLSTTPTGWGDDLLALYGQTLRA